MTTWVRQDQNVKPFWILLQQQMMQLAAVSQTKNLTTQKI